MNELCEYQNERCNDKKKRSWFRIFVHEIYKKHEMLIMVIALQDTLFQLSWYRTESVTVVVTRLRYGWTRVRIPKGTRNLFLSHNVYTGSWVHSASYSVGTGVLYRGYSNQRVKLITHLHLLRSLRMSGAIPLLPVCAFRVLIWTIVNATVPVKCNEKGHRCPWDDFKKGFVSAVLSMCIRANSRMSCDEVRLTRRIIIIIIIIIIITNCHCHQHENQ